MRVALLALLVPLSCAAADLGPSVEDQLRDLRRQIQMQEIQRDHDRSIDAIRAREQAAWDWNQRQIENTFLRDDLERRAPPRRPW